MIKEILYDREYFSPLDTLECGQIFRFRKVENGFLVMSDDRACVIAENGENTAILCNEGDEEYFYDFFDLKRDYSKIYEKALRSGNEFLEEAARVGKGVRILNQNKREMMISFLISQNNNIPRIKKIIENLCNALGEKRNFMGYEYYTFPKAVSFFDKTPDFYKGLGLGYRSDYIGNLKDIASDDYMNMLSDLSGEKLKSELLKIKGIGEKVADCICLFGFHKTDSFPVDTWIEKIYREDFKGELKNRKAITEYFVNLFGENSGYFQQYLFYYKRSFEKLAKK